MAKLLKEQNWVDMLEWRLLNLEQKLRVCSSDGFGIIKKCSMTSSLEYDVIRCSLPIIIIIIIIANQSNWPHN